FESSVIQYKYKTIYFATYFFKVFESSVIQYKYKTKSTRKLFPEVFESSSTPLNSTINKKTAQTSFLFLVTLIQKT
ncbi:MAG: hypothetical protein FWE36_08860, partial [Erysipelotrichales bacterium]|nr:hypothetical protein [Erysipelotrichales bacterium]